MPSVPAGDAAAALAGFQHPLIKVVDVNAAKFAAVTAVPKVT